MSTAMQAPTRDERFITALEQLIKQEDRAALAALRRGLGKEPGTAMEMHSYVARFTQGLSDYAEAPYYIVAALVGLYPTERWQLNEEKAQTNLGASFNYLSPPKSENRPSVERRFVALLNCNTEDLPDHLRQAISLLKSKDVHVDWLRLLRDIKQWERDDRRAQRQWAKAFWGDATDEASTTQHANLNTAPSSQSVETTSE
ncbi:MAG: type I-E CRISPR-associated protein Cse2/CasB [Pyrinomonadaceae bacterium]